MARKDDSSVKNLAKDLLPPIAWRGLRWLKHGDQRNTEYSGERWPLRESRSASWEDPSVANTMREHWDAYRRSVNSTKPLAFLTWFPEARDNGFYNDLVAFAYVVARAAHKSDTLSVLDWGGAFGHYALIANAIMPDVAFDYTVRDLPGQCAVGKDLMPTVKFTISDEEAFARRYDLVVASNGLHYAEAWRDITSRLAAAAKYWLFVSSLPIVVNHRCFAVVQHFQSYGFSADHPAWVFNRGEFLEHIASSGIVLEREFLSEPQREIRRAPEAASRATFLFRRR